MEKIKRIGAIVCVAIIAISYIITIVSVFLKVENWINYLYGSIFVTVVFPILLYGMLLVAKVVNKDNKAV